MKVVNRNQSFISDSQISNDQVNYVEKSGQQNITNFSIDIIYREFDIDGINYGVDQLPTVIESRYEVLLILSTSTENQLPIEDTKALV